MEDNLNADRPKKRLLIGIASTLAAGKGAFVKELRDHSEDVLSVPVALNFKCLELRYEARQISELYKLADKLRVSGFSSISEESMHNLHEAYRMYIRGLFAQQGDGHLFVDFPMLFEAGYAWIFDKVIFIDTPFRIRLHRFTRDGYYTSAQFWEAESKCQSASWKKEHSDYVLDKDTTFKDYVRMFEDLGLTDWKYPLHVQDNAEV